jgi:hypothetical protein
MFPLVITLAGAVVGAVVGFPLGLLNGLMLSAVRSVTRSRAVASGVAVLTTAAADLFLLPERHHLWAVGIAVLVVVLAGGFAPLAADGAQPVDFGSGEPARPFSHVVGTAVSWSVAAGGVMGMIIGAVVGGMSYLPTMPVAVLEGGFFGVATGLVLGLVGVGLVVLTRVELRH